MDYKSLMGYGKKKKVIKEDNTTVTDMLVEEFGELQEGPSYEYKKDIKNIDKSYKLHAKSLLDFYEKLRKKGLDNEASDLINAYKQNIVAFKKTYDKILRKLL
jgi:hypothetical protein